MSLAIRMPELTPGGTGATLVKWLVGVGTRVEPGDVVAEVESDKAIVELEAQASGVVEQIVVAEGTSDVAPERILATLTIAQATREETRRDFAGDAEASLGRTPGAANEAAPGSEPAELSPPAAPPSPHEDADPRAPAPSGSSLDRSPREPVQANASALARHLSHQSGLSVRDIAGSGPGGRVLAHDVLATLGPGGPLDGEARVGAPDVDDDPGRSRAPTLGRTRVDRHGALAPHELVPIDDVRRTVAHRLSTSKREAPHYYMSRHCRADALLELRAMLNRDLGPERSLSINDLLVKIVAETLRREPELNAAWDESGIRRFATVDLAVAVASPRGLITPIIRGAERKSLMQIAIELDELVSRANQGRLAPEEYRGGTFTVSNLGMYGVASFAAIINPPQAAILAVGAAEPTPVIVDSEVRSQHRMTCTLSVDHRVADGVAGAMFLAELSRLIDDPRRLVL